MTFEIRRRNNLKTNHIQLPDNQKADPTPKIYSIRHYLLSKIDQQKQQQNHGQGMVEFALALPILLLLVFGVIEAGRLLFFVSSVSSASREAARYGAAVGENAGGTLRFRDCAGIRDAAKRVGAFAGVQDANVNIQYDNGPGTTVFANSCPPNEADVSLGSRIIVNVSVPYKPIVPIVPIPAFPINSDNAHTILRSVYIGDGSGATENPTEIPTENPTANPTVNPTTNPTVNPTANPTEPTEIPTLPSCDKNNISITVDRNSNKVTLHIKNNGTTDLYWTSVGVTWSNNDPSLTGMSFGGSNNTLLSGLPANSPSYEERTWDKNTNWMIMPTATKDLIVNFASSFTGNHINKVAVKVGFNKQCTLTTSSQ